MRMRFVAIACLVALTVACGGGAEKGSPATEARQAPASATAGVNGFGVKECDDYLAKYTECVSSRVPEAVRAEMMAAIGQSKSQWQAAAATPEGRAGLAQACVQATEAAKASMEAYGCRW